MNCGDIHELLPLWHSGELEAGRRELFDAHIASCRACSDEIREQEAIDRRVQDAMVVESAMDAATVQGLQRRVMSEISRERGRRWRIPALTAAAVVLVAVGTGMALHYGAPVAPPVVTSAALADAARDHSVEIIGKAPRRWRTAAVDIAQVETTQSISDKDVKAIEATGYRLERAKICRLGGTPFVHLVYAKDGREISVYLKAGVPANVSGVTSSSGKLHLAAFEKGRLQAVIVSDAPDSECARFARVAQAAL